MAIFSHWEITQHQEFLYLNLESINTTFTSNIFRHGIPEMWSNYSQTIVAVSFARPVRAKGTAYCGHTASIKYISTRHKYEVNRNQRGQDIVFKFKHKQH